MINKKSTLVIMVLLFAIISFSPILAQNLFEADKIVDGKHNEERVLQINITQDKSFLYTVKKTLPPYYSVPEIDVLPNGNLLCIHSLEGAVEIYNPNGNIIFEHNFYNLSPYNEQRIFYSIYDDGAAFLISEENQNKIYTVKSSGAILFEQVITEGIAEGFASSNNANLLAYSILNWSVNEIKNEAGIISLGDDKQFDLSEGFTNGVFSENNELFIGFNKSTIVCTNLIESRTVWEKRVSGNELILDAEFNSQSVIILKSEKPTLKENTWQYNNSTVIEKQIDGKELQIKLVKENVKEIKLKKVENRINLVTDKDIIKIK